MTKIDSFALQALIMRYKTQLFFGESDLYKNFLEGSGTQQEVLMALCGRSALIDKALRELHVFFRFPEKMALIAVGGFGRGQLCPHSDIDLLFLLDDDANENPDEILNETIAAFLQVLWDIGCKIGHSVRSVSECISEAQKDLTVQTALVEMRLIVGNKKLFQHLYRQFDDALHTRTFFQGKKTEQEVRQQKGHNSPNTLEPNIKESPGGLRDLQTVLWVAKAAGFGNNWRQLRERKLLTQEEEEGLILNETFLQNMRIHLHLLASRPEDRLLFDYQTPLAEDLGFTDSDTHRASEMMMQKYYRTVDKVVQLAAILMQSMAELICPSENTEIIPINTHFQAVDGHLDLVEEDVFIEHPEAIFETFLQLQDNPKLNGLSARAMRSLWRARKLIDQNFRDNPINKAQFLTIFQAEKGVLREVRHLNRYALLGRYLPAFGKIIGQMQHDLFHIYTVDHHSLLTLKYLRQFAEEIHAHEYPFCNRLILEFDKPWRLYFAALFHDVGKGQGGDHAEIGAKETADFCASHALNEEDSALIVWLVKHHLLMSKVAQKEDFADPLVLQQFIEIVSDKTKLTALYLLTVADIRATSPKVWNAWKGQLLERLYLSSLAHLEGDKEGDKKDEISTEEKPRQSFLQARQAEARAHLGASLGHEEALWRTLDSVYFLRHSPDEIAWHTDVLHNVVHSEVPIVKARTEGVFGQEGERIDVLIYTADQDDLFVRMVAYFAHAGFSIVDAKIHTTNHGFALDNFVLQNINDEADEDFLTDIENALKERLLNEHIVDSPSSMRISRQVKHFPVTPEITLTATDHNEQFILSLAASDRQGLLFSIATILAKHDICLHTAKIATLGERVEDTFLVSGNNLTDTLKRMQLENELQQSLV